LSSPSSNPSSLIKFDRNKKFLGLDSAVGIEILPPIADLEVANALATNSPFPRRTIELGRESVKASAGRDIKFGDGSGKVSFAGSASAFTKLGVYFDPEAMLAALELNDNIAPGMKLEKDPNALYVVFRWGYDLLSSAKGSMALGAPGSISFGADGSREGIYAIVRRLQTNTGALTAVQQTLNSWLLPSQITTIDDLEPGTWLIADVDGAVAVQLGAQYGYDFNWVRQAQLGGLRGDIGLRLQLGVSAAIGFEASAKYAVVVSRDSGDPLDTHLRLRLFKQRKKGWDFAFNGGVSVQGTKFLPDKMDDFIKAVFGVQGAQVVKDLNALRKWTDPKVSPPDALAGLTVDYTLRFLGEVTGIDPRAFFEESRAKLVGFLDLWDHLPHGVATLLARLVNVDPTRAQAELIQIRDIANKISRGHQDDLANLINELLKDVDFFRTPVGTWLEMAAAGGVLQAISGTQEFTDLQRIAQVTSEVLKDDFIEKTVLVKLGQFIDSHLNLKQVEGVSDAAAFNTLDEWLKARLSNFLNAQLDLSQLEQIRKTIQLVLDKGTEFYQKTVTALQRKYEFHFSSTYQQSTTRTALLDIVFDFGVTGVAQTFKQALTGNFDTLLIEPRTGVSLNAATLTHQIERHNHVEINFPFYSSDLDHINQALAKVNAVNADEGRLLIYELDADDIVTTKNKRNSRLAVGGYLKVGNNQIRIHSTDPLSYSYSFRQVKKDMRRADLQYQLKPYVAAYFPNVFTSPPGSEKESYQAWVDDLDKTIDQIEDNGPGNFGNTLVSLELTLPAAVASAWLKASPDKNSPQYRNVSVALQSKLKQLIPFYYFQNLKNYGEIVPAMVLLVYAAIPPWTPPNDVYWEIQDPDQRKKMACALQTTMNLRTNLESVYTLLATTPGMEGTAAFFKPDQASRMQGESVEGIGDNLLMSLLLVESSVVRGARDAGVTLGKFLQDAATRPSDAIAALSDFGSKITETFNSKIKSVYGGEAVRPLGSMAFLEAASVLDPGTATARAMLDLVVVKQQAKFNLPDFLTGATPPKEDVVVQQRLVATG
jgi:hypothetical protein